MPWQPCCCGVSQCGCSGLPTTLYATFVRTSGACTVLDLGSLPLTWVPGTLKWDNNPYYDSGTIKVYIEYYCAAGSWFLKLTTPTTVGSCIFQNLNPCACPVMDDSQVATCPSPFSLTFTALDGIRNTTITGVCCTGVGTLLSTTFWDVTISI